MSVGSWENHKTLYQKSRTEVQPFFPRFTNIFVFNNIIQNLQKKVNKKPTEVGGDTQSQ